MIWFEHIELPNMPELFAAFPDTEALDDFLNKKMNPCVRRLNTWMNRWEFGRDVGLKAMEDFARRRIIQYQDELKILISPIKKQLHGNL